MGRGVCGQVWHAKPPQPRGLVGFKRSPNQVGNKAARTSAKIQTGWVHFCLTVVRVLMLEWS